MALIAMVKRKWAVMPGPCGPPLVSSRPVPNLRLA
jgi:hypothetical protein